MAHTHRYPSDLTDAQWAEIEMILPPPSKNGRNEVHPRREIVDALLYITHNGCVWRAMPSDFPPWQTVYGFFKRWRNNGTTARLNDELRKKARIQVGRDPEPSAAIIDAQSVKGASTVGKASRGYDGGKKINGRKRFVATDTLGLLLLALAMPASVSDPAGGKRLLVDLFFASRRTRHIFSDSGFAGDFVKWAALILRITVEVVRKPPGQLGFKVHPRRWVVERTLSWFMANRRLARDYERRTDSSESFMYWTMVRLTSRRVARHVEEWGEGDRNLLKVDAAAA